MVGFIIARGIQLTGCVVFSIVAIPAGGSAYSINESARAVSPIRSSQNITSLIFIGTVLSTLLHCQHQATEVTGVLKDLPECGFTRRECCEERQ